MRENHKAGLTAPSAFVVVHDLSIDDELPAVLFVARYLAEAGERVVGVEFDGLEDDDAFFLLSRV